MLCYVRPNYRELTTNISPCENHNCYGELQQLQTAPEEPPLNQNIKRVYLGSTKRNMSGKRTQFYRLPAELRNSGLVVRLALDRGRTRRVPPTAVRRTRGLRLICQQLLLHPRGQFQMRAAEIASFNKSCFFFCKGFLGFDTNKSQKNTTPTRSRLQGNNEANHRKYRL